MGVMRRGWLLGAIVIAAFGGTAWWTLRVTEPARRYDRIRGTLAAHRGQSSSAWSREESKAFWDSIEWFSSRHPDMLTHRLSRAIASEDPVEREGAIVLIDALLGYRTIFFPAVPVAPDVLPFHPRMDSSVGTPFELEKAFVGRSDAILRLSRDESTLTRISLLRVAQQVVSDDLEAALLRMCREESVQSIRRDAVEAFVAHSFDADGLRNLRDLMKNDATALRLTFAAVLAEAGDADGLREILRATEADSPAKAVHLLKGKIPERLLERLLRKYP